MTDAPVSVPTPSMYEPTRNGSDAVVPEPQQNKLARWKANADYYPQPSYVTLILNQIQTW